MYPAERARPGGARHAGVTLVELVIFIVVLSVGASAIALIMASGMAGSSGGDPMVRQQALLIAESYMEEIMLKRFLDPSAGTTKTCPTPEASRASYDNVCDYDGLANTSGVVDQFGNVVPGLESYNVFVAVTGSPGDSISLGPVGQTVSNTGALRVLRIDLTVTNDDFPDLETKMTGYRVNYRCYDSADTTNCKPR